MEQAARRRGTRRSTCVRATPWRPALLTALALLAPIASAGPLAASGEPVPLNAFNLPPGATVTLTFEVTVDNPLGVCASSISNQGTVISANHSNVLTDDTDVAGAANPTATVLDVVDLAITKTDGAATEVPGTGITYTITVTNAGPSTANLATVADTFPASLTGVSWSCSASAGSSCTLAGGGNINDIVTILSGGTLTYTVNATISASATGSLVNTATVTKAANQTECNTANNSSTDTDTLTPQVDLAITKTDGLTDINAGSPTTYTIVVTNPGPSDAVGATVTDTFPAALVSPTWSCAASAGSTCTNVSTPGNINDVVTVRAGGTLTYTVNATVSGTFSGTLSNTATVTAAGGTTDTNGGNNSATDTTNVLPIADLSVTKTDGVTTAVPGMTVTYTIVAANAGPATATGASVQDTFPASLTCTWTCVGAGGGTCTAGPTAGNIADSVNLPSGATATYTAVCNLSNSATGSLVNTVSISGGGVSDTTPGNNSATDTDTILQLDFGDAPNTPLGPPWAYPTLLANNGARHGITTLRMGAAIDPEADGQPTANADGDDQVAGPNVDDEDGVTLPAALVTCESAAVTVNASVATKLDAFIDFNRNGSFADAGEKIFDNLSIAAGANNLNFTVPCTATVTSQTFARFRVSTAGGLASNAVAADGEVEDYPIAIQGLDFGDAPDPAYPTLLASNGARHVTTGSLVLGSLRDAETNGQPNAAATGDDLAGVDDEDGVTFTSQLIPGQSATVTVIASAPGTLNAWIDFDVDGNWTTTGDQIFTNQSLFAGPNNLNFAVPATANSNSTVIARFRVATAGGVGFSGIAADGEVEDYAVAIVAVADLSITKTDGVTTEVPGTSVTYTITASNAGPDPVTGATVTDTFAGILSGVTWTCISAGGGTCTTGPVAGNINDSVNLPVGGSVTFTATGNIAPTATGTLVNTATVTVPGTAVDPIPGNNSATDTDTLTPETDLSVTKTDGAVTEIPGTPVTYTIVVTNNGPSTATGVSVTDTFPGTLSGCSWTSAQAGGVTGNTTGPVSGNISESGIVMPPTSSITYSATCSIDPTARGTLVNTASTASSTTDSTPGNNSATDTDTLAPEVDLSVTKVESIDPVVAGSGTGNLTYTITLANAGPSTATSVTASEVMTLPTGVTLVSVTPSQGSFASPTWTVGTVAPAGSATLTVVLTTAASTATGTDTICDTATVTGAAETIVNTGNDADTECTSVTRQVDIVVTKVESIDPVVAGSGTGNLTYTVTVANNGPSDASGITLSEVVTVPAGVTVDTVTPSQGTFVSPNWTAGSIASGGSATLTVVLTATAAAAPGTDVICDTASLTAVTETQVGTGNESDTECTSITVSADLSITKIDDADPPPAGSNLTYTITVTNNGPSNATGVVVTDPLPAATTYVSDTCGASNVPPWTWNIGNLANGASISCDVVVSINPTPPASISNTATVTATTNDAVPGNNSDTEDTTLDAVPPTITNVDSVAGTGDGSLDECETTTVSISTLLVTFDEGMNDPPGDSDPDDVTNPANYRVVSPGADFDFQTTGCGGAAGDDETLAIGGVTYDDGTGVATISLGSALASSQYRLFVCDELTDLAGNALDGDGDTNAGGDFARGFRADPGNLFANGHFDCDLADWNEVVANPNEIFWDGVVDADGADASGSAHFTNLAPGVDTSFRLDQCHDVPAPVELSIEYRVRLDAGAGVLVGVTRTCSFFSGPACVGALGTSSSATVLGDTGDAFLTLSQTFPPAAGTVSARCAFVFSTSTGAMFDAYLDATRLTTPALLFADDFESGDTSAWSLTVP